MSKPSRPLGTIPAAFSKTGQDVPPSPEVAAQGVAEVIGGAVALHLAQLLAPVLQRLVDVQERYACVRCAHEAVRADMLYKIALANAAAAAEPEPDKPDVKIQQAFTVDPDRGPVCWTHFSDPND